MHTIMQLITITDKYQLFTKKLQKYIHNQEFIDRTKVINQ